MKAKKYNIIYTKPTVFQKRNKHDLMVDFKNEYLGYINNLELINAIEKNPENITNFLPNNSLKAFDEWIKVLSK